MKRIIFILSFILLYFLISNSQNIPDYALGQVAVRLTQSAVSGLSITSPQYPYIITNKSELNHSFKSLNIYRMESLTFPGDTSIMNRWYSVYFPSNQDVDVTIRELEQNEFIEVAEKNMLFFTKVTPNDPLYLEQWNLTKIKMDSAWDIEKGKSDIRIAVLDVGFKLDHEDLINKFSSTIKKDFTDININNYIIKGYYLINGEDYTTEDDDPTGIDPHGTAVAGIAAAETNNDTGIAGVGWNTTIVPVKCGFVIIHPRYGYIGMFERDNWIKALNWVRINNYAKVVNMSFGRKFSNGAHVSEQNAINAALAAGIVLVAASGNENDSVCYPAAYPGVIAVGATKSDDYRWSESNYGTQLSIVAPGHQVFTTTFTEGDFDDYAASNGTSLSAPHVSGAAALILSKNNTLTPANVKLILEISADRVPGMSGDPPNNLYSNVFNIKYGYGRLNVKKALELSDRKPITFINKIQETQNYGNLVLNNDKQNPVQSGTTRLLLLDSNYVVRTNELPFLPNWNNTGKTEKFHRFYETGSIYQLNHQFKVKPETPSTQDANFSSTVTVLLKTEMIELPNIDSLRIDFKDPFFYHKDVNNDWHQSNEFKEYKSPLNITNNSINSYGGVFLNQEPSPTTPNVPYYSVRVPRTQIT